MCNTSAVPINIIILLLWLYTCAVLNSVLFEFYKISNQGRIESEISKEGASAKHIKQLNRKILKILCFNRKIGQFLGLNCFIILLNLNWLILDYSMGVQILAEGV